MRFSFAFGPITAIFFIDAESGSRLFLFCNRVIDSLAISNASFLCSSLLTTEIGIFVHGTNASSSISPRSKRPIKIRMILLLISSSRINPFSTASGNILKAGPAHSTSVPARTALAPAWVASDETLWLV